jgi:subtilase family serine protease
VKNRGKGDAGVSRLACYIGAEYQGYVNIAALEAGAERTVEVTWTALAGTHRIKAHTDFNNDIVESDETNNIGEVDFFIIPPDLIIRDLTWTPEKPSLGDEVDFTLTIANEGSGEAQNFHTSYYLDGKMIDAHYTTSLAADTAANITFSWTAELGNHEFTAFIDSNRVVFEHQEDNNEYSVVITPIVPDLTVEKIAWSPGEISAGDTVTVTVTIKNSGTDRAVPFRNAYYIDGAIAGYQDVQELQAGETASQNILWTAAAGLHSIRITLDYDNRVTENDENNNVRTVYFPPPDLTIQEVSIAPQEAAVREPVTITVTMLNRGEGKAVAPSVSYFVNGELGDSLEFPDMEPGAALTRTLTWLAGAGPCNITVTADAAKVVMESDETNNERSLHYGTLTADLMIEDIVCTQDNPKDEDDITFGVVIGNQGSYAAGKSRVALYIDGERIGEHESSAVPAGGSFTEKFQIVVESGEHTIRAVADATGLVPEIDETNNELEKAYSTVTPDLVVDGLTWSPTEALVGDSVVFSVPVKNQGRATAESIHVALYVDGEEIGNHDIMEIARGETVTKTFNWTALPGSHEISVMLDMDNNVVESNEDNNTAVRTIALPDAPGAGPLPTPEQGGGLLDDLWWLLYVVALVFGGIAFYAVLRTAKKGPK